MRTRATAGGDIAKRPSDDESLDMLQFAIERCAEITERDGLTDLGTPFD
jgi:hypothetical protein